MLHAAGLLREEQPTIHLDPGEAALDRERRRAHFHLHVVPILRLLALNSVAAGVLLHNRVILQDFSWAEALRFLAVVEGYCLAAWVVLRALYGRVRVDLPGLVMAADTLFLTYCVYVSGGDRSWMFWMLAVRIADQIATSARRVVFFAHLSAACYVAMLLWIQWVDGRPVSWPAEAAKTFFLYSVVVYFATAATTAQALRRRTAAAIDLARGLISAMDEKAEQLRIAKRAAEEASQAKNEFLSRMSHELRTPMNAILGFAQLIEMERPSERERESVEQILRAGRHLLGLIDEVLDIARIEAGRLSLSLEAVPLEEVLGGVLALVRPIAAQRGVHLPGAPGGTGDRHVLADRRRLEQVLLNLCSNAIKYNRVDGSVHVGWEDLPDGRVRISVSDTGVGIPEEQRERLFLPFERLGAEHSDVEGSGIGLALSRGLAEAMGGTLEVESRPGEGSTFRVELPRAESPVERAADVPLAEPVETRPEDARTVLYVEDNPSNYKLVERVLAHRPGLRLLSAMQGRMGLELAWEHRPELILLDLHLPDIGGAEVLQRLREDPRTVDTPVVVISADASPGQIDRLLAAGAVAYLTKPLDVRQFLAVVDQTVGGGVPT